MCRWRSQSSIDGTAKTFALRGVTVWYGGTVTYKDGTEAGLASEWSYSTVTLPMGVLRNLRRALGGDGGRCLRRRHR